MTSAFDRLCGMANAPLFDVFGDAVTIDGEAGFAIVTPDSDLALGGGTQLINGAHLTVRSADFPDITYHSEVVHGAVTYLVMEMDDVDSAGVRQLRMARE